MEYEEFRNAVFNAVHELISGGMSYREFAERLDASSNDTAVFSHTRIWGFHKNNARLPFDVMQEIADRAQIDYQLTNGVERGDKPAESIPALEEMLRCQISQALSVGISYKSMGRKTGMSHEWIRLFHSGGGMDASKLFYLANYLGVKYDLRPRKIRRKELLLAVGGA